MSGSSGVSPLPGSAGGPPIRRILLMQLKWMGDVLLTTPAIRAVRRAFPDAKIDFVTGVEGAAVLQGNPHLDEIIAWRRGFVGGLRAMSAIADRRYDAVVDFRSTPRDAWYVLASHARLRIGMRGRGPRNLVYTQLFDRDVGPAYMAARKLEPLRALGIDPAGVADLSLELVVSEAEREFTRALFARHGLAGDAPVVAMSPVSRVHYKQWGAEKWAAVADRIADSGARILLTSGPGELEQAQACAERMRHPAVWNYGGSNIRQLAAMYERCALWVGNDGGAKHIAVAVGTPTVSVFRYRESAFWTDASPSSPHRAIEKPPVLACIYPHCGDCAHLSCLEQLKSAEVTALVEQAHARAPRRPELTGPGPKDPGLAEDPRNAGSSDPAGLSGSRSGSQLPSIAAEL